MKKYCLPFVIFALFFSSTIHAELKKIEDEALASIDGQEGVVIDVEIGSLEIPHLNYLDEEKKAGHDPIAIWMLYDMKGGLKLLGQRIDVIDYEDLFGETVGAVRFGLHEEVELTEFNFTFGFASAPEATLSVYGPFNKPGSGVVDITANTRFVNTGGIVVLTPKN